MSEQRSTHFMPSSEQTTALINAANEIFDGDAHDALVHMLAVAVMIAPAMGLDRNELFKITGELYDGLEPFMEDVIELLEQEDEHE